MFTTSLGIFKTQEKELHRQAAQHRLAKSLEQNNSLANKFFESLGQILILSGQQLINNTRAAAH